MVFGRFSFLVIFILTSLFFSCNKERICICLDSKGREINRHIYDKDVSHRDAKGKCTQNDKRAQSEFRGSCYLEEN